MQLAISDGVRTIGSGAFAGCMGLGTITLPRTLAAVEDYAFLSCSNLTTARFLGDAPTQFGRDVFRFTPTEFSIRYTGAATGFSTPVWHGYPAFPELQPGLITIANLAQTYDGRPKPVAVSTFPAGLAVSVTYNGSPEAPVNAGGYAVAATIVDSAYGGHATGALMVLRAPQTIGFGPLPDRVVGDSPFTLEAVASSGLPVLYASDNPTVASVVGNSVTLGDAGTAILTASQPGDSNFEPAPPVTQSLTVAEPRLRIRVDKGGVLLDWSGFGLRLEQATTPLGPWTPLSATVLDAPQKLPVAGEARYFRLGR